MKAPIYDSEKLLDILSDPYYSDDDWSNEIQKYGKIDLLFDEAALVVVQREKFSEYILKDGLHIDTERAKKLIEQLSKHGIIDVTTNKVLIANEKELTEYLELLIPEKIETRELNYIEAFKWANSVEIEKRRQEKIDSKNQERLRREKELIKKKFLEKEQKKTLEKEVFEELLEAGLIFNKRTSKEKIREPIPKDVMNQVWNRDGGACVQCGSRENLEFDHIIPVSKGGATTYRNLQLLCQKCNREKSDKI